ncbi:hypothetical protein D3C85_1366960 [compost metagenome]
MPMPVTKEKKQPSAKLRSLSARRSTTGLAWVSERQMKAAPARPEIQAVARMTLSPNQSQRGPSSSVYSRQPRNTAINPMPR